jgi:carboxymethylenebutenolidase
LLHAWWGLNPFFQGLADRLATEGFTVLAPDMYGGQVAQSVEEAQQLRAESNKGPATKSALLTGALDYLRRCAGKDHVRYGLAGFSMGAHWAMWLAANRPADIAAVVLFYGTRQIDPSKSQADFMGHFADTDPYVSGKAVADMEKRLKAAERTAEFYKYPGTGHWFFEEDRADAYNPEAAALSWERTLRFLSDRLTPGDKKGD